MSRSDVLLSVLDKGTDSTSVAELLLYVSEAPIKLTKKDFKSVSYQSAQECGISLQYEQQPDSEEWMCKAIDLYNDDAVKGWSSFTRLPIEASLMNEDGKTFTLRLEKDTSGVDIIKQLGEPDRTGGGEPLKGGGASGLGPSAWMEWKLKYRGKKIDVMIELAGQEARGRDRWEKERAGAALWGICTFASVSSP